MSESVRQEAEALLRQLETKYGAVTNGHYPNERLDPEDFEPQNAPQTILDTTPNIPIP